VPLLLVEASLSHPQFGSHLRLLSFASSTAFSIVDCEFENDTRPRRNRRFGADGGCLQTHVGGARKNEHRK
jgi:hypothetical protein